MKRHLTRKAPRAAHEHIQASSTPPVTREALVDPQGDASANPARGRKAGRNPQRGGAEQVGLGLRWKKGGPCDSGLGVSDTLNTHSPEIPLRLPRGSENICLHESSHASVKSGFTQHGPRPAPSGPPPQPHSWGGRAPDAPTPPMHLENVL